MQSKEDIKTGKDLRELYDTFVNSTFDELKLNSAGEYVRVFNISEWIHIAFMRFEDEPSMIEIEVEVSLPAGKCGETLGDTSNQIQLLQDMMTNMTYIKNLVEKGFKLSVIKEDCLWVATHLVSERPMAEFFDALVPPG